MSSSGSCLLKIEMFSPSPDCVELHIISVNVYKSTSYVNLFYKRMLCICYLKKKTTCNPVITHISMLHTILFLIVVNLVFNC